MIQKNVCLFMRQVTRLAGFGVCRVHDNGVPVTDAQGRSGPAVRILPQQDPEPFGVYPPNFLSFPDNNSEMLRESPRVQRVVRCQSEFSALPQSDIFAPTLKPACEHVTRSPPHPRK